MIAGPSNANIRFSRWGLVIATAAVGGKPVGPAESSRHSKALTRTLFTVACSPGWHLNPTCP